MILFLFIISQVLAPFFLLSSFLGFVQSCDICVYMVHIQYVHCFCADSPSQTPVYPVHLENKAKLIAVSGSCSVHREPSCTLLAGLSGMIKPWCLLISSMPSCQVTVHNGFVYFLDCVVLNKLQMCMNQMDIWVDNHLKCNHEKTFDYISL